MLLLSKDLVLGILKYISPRDVVSLCLSCKKLNELCSSDYYWKPVFQSSFPQGQEEAWRRRTNSSLSFKGCFLSSLKSISYRVLRQKCNVISVLMFGGENNTVCDFIESFPKNKIHVDSTDQFMKECLVSSLPFQNQQKASQTRVARVPLTHIDFFGLKTFILLQEVSRDEERRREQYIHSDLILVVAREDNLQDLIALTNRLEIEARTRYVPVIYAPLDMQTKEDFEKVLTYNVSKAACFPRSFVLKSSNTLSDETDLFVELLFERLDKNKDGYLNKEEFELREIFEESIEGCRDKVYDEERGLTLEGFKIVASHCLSQNSRHENEFHSMLREYGWKEYFSNHLYPSVLKPLNSTNKHLSGARKRKKQEFVRSLTDRISTQPDSIFCRFYQGMLRSKFINLPNKVKRTLLMKHGLNGLAKLMSFRRVYLLYCILHKAERNFINEIASNFDKFQLILEEAIQALQLDIQKRGIKFSRYSYAAARAFNLFSSTNFGRETILTRSSIAPLLKTNLILLFQTEYKDKENRALRAYYQGIRRFLESGKAKHKLFWTDLDFVQQAYNFALKQKQSAEDPIWVLLSDFSRIDPFNKYLASRFDSMVSIWNHSNTNVAACASSLLVQGLVPLEQISREEVVEQLLTGYLDVFAEALATITQHDEVINLLLKVEKRTFLFERCIPFKQIVYSTSPEATKHLQEVLVKVLLLQKREAFEKLFKMMRLTDEPDEMVCRLLLSLLHRDPVLKMMLDHPILHRLEYYWDRHDPESDNENVKYFIFLCLARICSSKHGRTLLIQSQLYKIIQSSDFQCSDLQFFKLYIDAQLKPPIEPRASIRMEILDSIDTLMMEDEVGFHVFTTSYDFDTIRCETSVKHGRWCYEVELITRKRMNIGWASLQSEFSSEDGIGVGDDGFSYAVDLSNLKKFHGKKSRRRVTPSYGSSWETGDYLGCFLNMDEKTISYTLNGKDLGVAFSRINVEDLCPAVSLSTEQNIRINLGKKTFKYGTVLNGVEYKAFCEQEIKEVLEVE